MTPAPAVPVAEEFASWLADFLPRDYYQRYPRCRWDVALRRDYQRAAFEAGWIQPTWPRRHGGRSLGLAEAWRSGSKPRCDRRPSCPTSPGQTSLRRVFISSVHPARSIA